MIVPPARTRGGRLSLLVTALAATSALTLAACGSSAPTASGGGSTPSGNPNSGTIVWWVSPITTTSLAPRTVLINAFEKVHPNIHVHLQSAPNNTDTNRASVVTTISGGSASPNVFMGDVIWPAGSGAHQLAVPLSKYMKCSYWSAFARGLVAGATYKGQISGALLPRPGFPVLPEGPAFARST